MRRDGQDREKRKRKKKRRTRAGPPRPVGPTTGLRSPREENRRAAWGRRWGEGKGVEWGARTPLARRAPVSSASTPLRAISNPSTPPRLSPYPLVAGRPAKPTVLAGRKESSNAMQLQTRPQAHRCFLVRDGWSEPAMTAPLPVPVPVPRWRARCASHQRAMRLREKDGGGRGGRFPAVRKGGALPRKAATEEGSENRTWQWRGGRGRPHGRVDGRESSADGTSRRGAGVAGEADGKQRPPCPAGS